MVISSRHKHVDADGLIVLPYLSMWEPQTHTLKDLIPVISKVFGM
jgi:hypothetical protein